MKMWFLVFLMAPAAALAQPGAAAQTGAVVQEDLLPQLLTVKRVYVDRLTGGETAAQMRDLIISSLQNSKLFILTENPDRADAFVHGAAEDLIYTDDFQSSDSVDIRGGLSGSSHDASYRTGPNSDSPGNGESRSLTLGAGEHDSTNIKERKHEALATVRLVNKDGDVLWSTTQESNGAKFRGASADVAEKITHQLTTEYDKLRKAKPAP
ncbi:MAG TPA: hypothetical protein VGG72_00365 [Bryobacteraceae bacterium]|jgi:hypothetical protein